MYIIKTVQAETLSLEIKAVQQGKRVPKWLGKLSPFVDEKGILRVGGRLANSDLPYATKHPALLPRIHRLNDLIIQTVHEQYFHAGVDTTIYLLQQTVWIPSARRTVRRCISRCNQCFKNRPVPVAPPMGNLPRSRVSQLKAFSCAGVDFAGPFTITMGRTRGAKTMKAYLCLFVCFATKALHVELASNLSTDAFLAALRRFIARRGRCSRLFSDCGTNFVGAHRELTRFMKIAAEAEEIHWSFNPPSASHFGGLWESGVKVVKTHLHRVIGLQILTYEELNTVLVQIEAMLNSRPLCPVSSDPNDLTALTPGHFLTLEPLTAAPDPDLSHLKISRLSRWQLIQQLQQNFWSRWRNEYLHTLYQKSKWLTNDPSRRPIEGTLVLIKDDLSPPLKWRLGRIHQLFPGTDGVARVASVNTAYGLVKRPLIKLCALPSQ